MSGWGTNGNANRIKDTYIKGFLDVSGGPLIVEKSSSLQVMAHDSDHPVIEFKPEYFTVTTTSAIDISYSALAAIGFLGVSFENSTTDITNRVKYITTGTNFTEIGNDDEKSDLQVYGLIKGHYGLEVDGDVSLNNNLFVAGDSSMNNNLSVGGNLYVEKRSVFSLDVSMNGNLSVNNDLSLNGNLYVVKKSFFGGDVSFNGKLYVNNDLSLNGNLYVAKKSFFGGDVSMNTNLYVNNDLSLNGNLYVSKRGLFTLDVSMNGNVKLGSGSTSVSVNKDISSSFALDVSGLTVLRNTLYVGSDVSLNTNLYVNNDLSLNGNLYVVKRSLFTLDASFNGNTKLGSGSTSVSVNKDISSAFALDVSGLTVLRNTLYVGSDVSLNTNLYVNNDLSLNGNLYVVKRSVFTLDVSMSQNLDIGSGSSSVSINKDISSAFALDVSGVSKFRGNVDVSGTFTVNGAPVSGGGGSLTGNVQVGSNSGFVSIDKPQFYSDPSLAIYYDFDVNFVVSGLYVAVGDGTNTFATSSNGTAWSGGGSAIITTQARHIAYGNGTYVAVGTGGNSIASSTDGVTWTGRSTTAVGGSGYGIAYGNGIWVALGFGGGGFASCIGTSTDLVTWTPRSATVFTTGGNGYGAAYVNGRWVAGGFSGGGGNTLATSIDNGVTWTGLGSTVFDNNCRNVVYANGLWVAVGGGSVNAIATSPDGTTWTGGTNFVGGTNTATIFSSGYSVAYGKDGVGNGLWIAVGTGSVNTIAKSTNGTVWTGLGKPVFATAGWDVIYTGSLWIAVGEGGNSYASSVDGTIWNGGGTTGLNTAGRGVVVAKVPETTTIANKGNGGAGFTATLQGTTTGMIDDVNFKYGTTSLKNDTLTLLNQGIKVNSTAVPIGRTMTISFWLRKKSTPPATTFDRIFEFSTNASVGAVGENNSIALDISSSGIILPVLTNSTASCFGTLSTPISYNVCDDAWKHIVWSINGSSSVIYVNGSNTQQDTITGLNPFDVSSVRTSLTIGHSTVTSLNSRDFSGNLDDFRYYKDKALSYAEIYQLYNNNFYTLDICGGFLANGPSVIYEATGSVATANSGTLTLLHGDAGGSSSIMFKSVNSTNDYAYVQYNVSLVQSVYKWNLSPGANITYGPSTNIDTSVGSNTSAILATSNYTTVFSVLAPSPPSTFPSNTYCISFNQTNQTGLPGSGNINYIQTGVAAMQENITISFWIRPNITWDTTNIGGNYYSYYLAHFSNSGTNVIEIFIRGSDQKLFVLINGNASNFKITNSSITNNVWTHVAFTYSASPNNGYIYINGVRDENIQGTGYTAFGSLNTYGNLLIGTRWDSTNGANYRKGFRGYMNFINIFDLTLSDSNILYLYNNPSYGQTTEGSLMTIGIENSTLYNDRIALWPNSGTGYVGINTKTPQTTLDVSGGIQAYSYNATSDYRAKDEVVPLNMSFTVDSLNPVTYKFKATGKQDVGFIAHEVQELYPFLVNGEKDGPHNQSLNYNGFIGILTKEIKELKKKVFEQEAKALAKAVDQEQRIQALEKMMSDRINK